MPDPVDIDSRSRPINGESRYDDRLRSVESRLVRIETELSHLVTKEDLEALKTFFSDRENKQQR